MTGLYTDAFLEELRVHAEALAPQWGLSPATSASLLNISENATFRLDDPEASASAVVRIHRPGYHAAAEIDSELAWIEALRADGVVATPAILPLRSGGKVAAFEQDGTLRHAVAFAWMEGAEPEAGAGLVRGFRELGAISARLHGHARAWPRPEGFVRKTWNWETTVGPVMHWGDWRAADGWTPRAARSSNAPPRRCGRGSRPMARGPIASGSSMPICASPTCSSIAAGWA